MDRLDATHLAVSPPRNDGRHFRVEWSQRRWIGSTATAQPRSPQTAGQRGCVPQKVGNWVRPARQWSPCGTRVQCDNSSPAP